MLAGILAGLAAGALWGLVFIAPRLASGFASVDLTAGRFVAYGAVAAGMVLWGMVRRRAGQPRCLPTLRQAGAALWLSVLGFTGYYLLLVLAIRDAGAPLPALIIGTIPVWVMVLGKPRGLRWGALAMRPPRHGMRCSGCCHLISGTGSSAERHARSRADTGGNHPLIAVVRQAVLLWGSVLIGVSSQ
ncbi:EamA family transporter [Paracidovorax avenae]|uniref:EamA family transporter n=1 Tax=Paracidovorax avenae TaxID=80867 RepID=UPI0026C3E86C